MTYEYARNVINKKYDEKIQPLKDKIKSHKEKIRELYLKIDNINGERIKAHDKNREFYGIGVYK